ncbi:Metallo-dependent hydrolase, partial [Gymnopus androsaceus JB14]
FLLSPFTDLHLHAPQFLYQGTGLDLPLLQWLHQYAFKAEASLDCNPSLARKVYRQLGRRLIKAGTGAVCLFGTLDLKGETNLILVEEMRKAGIRAFVGKVSMDISSRPEYVEASANAAVASAREFGVKVASSSSPSLVHPVITPRFVPTCSDELLHGLGALAKEKGWRIQSHMAESRDQVDNNNSFTHLAKLGTSIAHCPLSNIYFSASRSFALREALDADVKVGLGTDVAGGYSLDIMSAMRTAVAVSRIREGQREKEPCGVNATNGPNAKSLAIDWKESLFLATSGGAKALGIDSGLFAVGRPFDAQQICLLDTNRVGVGALDFFELEKEKTSEDRSIQLLDEMIEKWWCVGDERNRMGMWIQGA